MIRRAARVPALAMLTVILAGCVATGPDLTQQRLNELNRHRARWSAADVDSYRYHLMRSCECLWPTGGNFVVTVENGVVVRAESEHDGEPLAEDHLASMETVEDLFDRIAAAIDAEVFRLDVEYDPDLGYPRFLAAVEIEGVVDYLVTRTQDLVALD